MSWTGDISVRADLEWLKDRKELLEVRYRPVRGNCRCDWCQEFIPKGSNAAKIGRVVTDEIWKRKDKIKVVKTFQRHALLCPDCGDKYKNGDL